MVIRELEKAILAGAEITPAEHTNLLVTVYSAIRDSIRDFVEYLS